MSSSVYGLPLPDASIDQGDIIENCPIVLIPSFDPATLRPAEGETVSVRVIVLTQTCDFANGKVTSAVCAVARDAQTLVAENLVKPADIKGPIRSGRIWGWYFLPGQTELGLSEMIVDLRQLHTVRLDLLIALCKRGLRRARVQPLYREHLAKHFADTYSRIGLPEPYPTD
jgi:hypothetical protein